VPGVDKSAVYRINPDNTVETLWSSKEENVYDVLPLEKQILFSTDQNGRIYGLGPDLRVTLVTETNEGETTRLLPAGHSILAATGNTGRIFRMDEKPGATGSYEAPVHDSGTASRWGSLSWRAEVPAGCSLAFRTRSGNSAKPDRTWSGWSGPPPRTARSPPAPHHPGGAGRGTEELLCAFIHRRVQRDRRRYRRCCRHLRRHSHANPRARLCPADQYHLAGRR